MRLDYSDKVAALRESPERKPLQKPAPKNRPRKAPLGLFAFLSALLLLGATFGAGVFTGWLLFRGSGKPAAAGSPAAAVQAKQAQVPPPAAPGAPVPETPLTFYKTLPSGGHGAMGSGVNLKLSDPPPQSKAVPAAPAAKAAEGTPSETRSAPEKGAQEKGTAEKQEPQKQEPAKAPAAAETRYLVQIASYRDKKEADTAQSKLSAKGVAAYLAESRVQGKGVWYRLRVGRHLSKAEAEQLAAKLGSGATALPE
ncbi:sporulation protein [Geoanaerobacter pelophilus]|uniref:Sporulation protein n=1 Tax=Geoanaerobacter pelophilus TaxID=60036 RepID=A0ABQ0MGM2_9BACT|nr:SPOR domain-containing protein [Geoanaerobacter pelophilus]GAW66240.1 sporulation protein [Geoanaerobacter pelophilus]